MGGCPPETKKRVAGVLIKHGRSEGAGTRSDPFGMMGGGCGIRDLGEPRLKEGNAKGGFNAHTAG